LSLFAIFADLIAAACWLLIFIFTTPSHATLIRAEGYCRLMAI